MNLQLLIYNRVLNLNIKTDKLPLTLNFGNPMKRQDEHRFLIQQKKKQQDTSLQDNICKIFNIKKITQN